jgi:hypothetical protein
MISFEKFLNWAESRFGDVKVRNKEIKINSIFCEDYKHHLYCNPSGGKNNLPYGAYRCWKTDRTGSLVSLVMIVDKCSFEEALETLDSTDLNLYVLQEKIENLFSKNNVIIEQNVKKKIDFPPFTYKISELNENDIWRTDAEIYLSSRKLPIDKFYICTQGDYKNRIVIPYYLNNELVYWNARLLQDKKNSPKYLGPDKSCGIGKSDVIYFPKPIYNKSKLYITEGELDAESISISGLDSAAIGGKSLEEKQIEFLRGYIPVLCFDTDNKKIDAGGEALLKIALTLKSKGFSDIFFVRPPLKFKDWNKMLVETNPKIVNNYILLNEKPFDDTTELKLKLNKM